MSENALITNLGIREANGVAMVNSRVVARYFEKRHDNVVRDIEALVGSSEVRNLKYQGVSAFTLVLVQDEAANKLIRTYDMTRSGFTLLAMGWTGEKALGFKVAYIQEFDLMEEALRENQAAPAIDLSNPTVVDWVLDQPAVQHSLLSSPVRLRNMVHGLANRVNKLEIENTVLKMDQAELASRAVSQAEPEAPVPARISPKPGECSLRQASKEIFGEATAIFSVLRDLRWLYKNGSGVPQQDKINAGYLVVREGGGASNVQTMITAKGRVKLVETLQTMAATAAERTVAIDTELSPKSISILLRAGYLKPPSYMTGRSGRPKKPAHLNGSLH
jgi:Rha family phage regulatory protein